MKFVESGPWKVESFHVAMIEWTSSSPVTYTSVQIKAVVLGLGDKRSIDRCN